jgi:hypothetical protein
LSKEEIMPPEDFYIRLNELVSDHALYSTATDHDRHMDSPAFIFERTLEFLLNFVVPALTFMQALAPKVGEKLMDKGIEKGIDAGLEKGKKLLEHLRKKDDKPDFLHQDEQVEEINQVVETFLKEVGSFAPSDQEQVFSSGQLTLEQVMTKDYKFPQDKAHNLSVSISKEIRVRIDVSKAMTSR